MHSEKIKQDGMKKFAEERIQYFISDFTIKNQSEVVSHLREMMEKTNPAGAAAVQRGRAERKDLTLVLKSIKVPTLIMVGENDEFTPIKTAQFIHERIKNSRLSIIEKAGHISNIEQAEKFNSVLKAFLNGNY
jgi:3-oxoadipate enol-lactonase